MESTMPLATRAEGWRLWTAVIVKGLVVAFLLFDGIGKLLRPAPVVEGTRQLGFSVEAIVPIGVTLLAITVLYVLPRTAVLGAVLLTGYLGGAVASQVRIAAPTFNVVFPIFFAALAWATTYLLDERVRTVLPVRR